jgi:hypothetical protein
MRQIFAFVIVIILGFLLLTPLVWWIIKGTSFFEIFDIVTGQPVATSTYPYSNLQNNPPYR